MKKLAMILAACMICSGCSVLDIMDGVGDYDKAIESKQITLYENSTTQEVASAVGPAIVGISGRYSNGESVGSGVCLAEGGYILTNSHVISGADKITLYLSDKSSATAKIIYDNPVLDLAIIKSSKNMPYLPIGSSDDILVGEDVLAVGTPLTLTLTHTFTKGIVSALNRTLKVDSDSGEGYMQNLIQHDASLNPGNSGGPLLNGRGEVIGINTLKIATGEGIGFAIPSKSFESLLGSYVKNINYEVPYLGLYGYDSEIANYEDSSISSLGFYVLSVNDNSPLINLGVTKGCVVTEFNGKKINNTLDLKDELYKLTTSDMVELVYENNGVSNKVKVCLK